VGSVLADLSQKRARQKDKRGKTSVRGSKVKGLWSVEAEQVESLSLSVVSDEPGKSMRTGENTIEPKCGVISPSTF